MFNSLLLWIIWWGGAPAPPIDQPPLLELQDWVLWPYEMKTFFVRVWSTKG